jgi:hypothetical protein
LNAVEAQLAELGQELEDAQVEAADAGAAEIQLFQLGQCRQAFNANVTELRMAQVERSQAGQLGDMGEADIGDIGAAEIELAEAAIGPKVRKGRIGDELGGIQVQFFQLLQLGKALDAAVCHVSEREIEPFEAGDFDEAFNIVVRGPGAGQRYFDDGAIRTADYFAALRFDPRLGVGRDGERDQQGRDERRRHG